MRFLLNPPGADLGYPADIPIVSPPQAALPLQRMDDPARSGLTITIRFVLLKTTNN